MKLPVLLFLFLGVSGVAAAQTPRIVLTPRSVTLSAPAGSGLSSAQTVAVNSGGPSAISGLSRTISYAAGQPTGWLRAILSGSNTPATLTLQGRASAALLPGTYAATVTVRTRFLSRTVAVSFRVVSLPPAIGVAATANLTAPAGSLTPATLLLDVTNTGSGTLGGLQASVSYPAGETPGWLTAVLGRPDAPAMAPTRLRLRATPAQNLLPGVHHATVRITSAQASNSPQLVDVAFDITGTNPLMALSPSSVSFIANIGPGDPAPQSVAVTNAGGGTVERLSRAITYAQGQPNGWLRAAFGAKEAPTTLELRAVNTAALVPGVYSATVEVNSTTAFNAPQSIAVTLAVGSSPAHLTLTPTAHDFGSVGVGGASAAQAFTITNDGGLPSGPLMAPSGPFSAGTLVGGPNAGDFRPDPTSSCVGAAGGLAPHASCDIVLWFSPSAAGARLAALNVGASPGGTLLATLTGTGTTTPVIVVTPPAHDYGDVGGGTPIPTQRFVLTNPLPWPTGPLQLLPGLGNTGILGGPNPGDFSVEPNSNCVQVLATGLPVGGSCFFDVTFIPQGLGARSAVIAFQMTPGGVVEIALSGNGLGIGFLSISPASHDFGSVGIGGASAAQAFTITNHSNLSSGPLTPTNGPFGVALGLGGANPGDFRPDLTSSCIAAASGLAPHASCDIVLWFSPTAAGARSAVLTLSASPGGTVLTELSGTGTNASPLSVTPAAHDYGDIGVGLASPVQRFVLTNTLPWPTGPFQPVQGPFGSSAPPVSGPNPGDFLFDQNSSCAQAASGLPVGGSCYIDVTFLPQGLGARSALIAFQMTSGGIVQIPLSGNGVAAQILTLSPTSHDFGTVDVGLTSPAQRYTLTNTGAIATGRLVPQGPGGANPGDFGFTLVACAANSGGGLDPGATCVFDVTFTPTADGTRSAFVGFSSTPGGTVTTQLVGTGIFRIVALTISPTAHDFGVVPVGQTSPGQTFTVTNQGPLVGVNTQGVSNQDFSIDLDGSCSGLSTLAGGESCTINVHFNPQTPGPHTGTVVLTTTAGEATATITGTGAPPPASAIAIDPALYLFGSVLLGQTSPPATFTITNSTASRTGTINSFALTGTGTAEYAISQGTCAGAALDPGATCTFSVTFAPTVAAGHPVTLTVTTTQGESGATELHGFGQAPAVLTVTPSPHDFGFVIPPQTSAPVTFTVTNTGAGISGFINWLGITFSGPDSADFNFLDTGWTCFATIQLAPGASCTVDVIFMPHATGPRSAILTITANGVGGGTGTATLTGGHAPGGVLTMAPTAHVFAATPVGLFSLPGMFTVKNTGTTPALIFNLELLGPAPSSYELDPGTLCRPGTWLDVGAECGVVVVFRPQSLGTLTATVRLTYDIGTATASLTGVGTTLTISSSSAEQDLLGVPALSDSERVHLDGLGNRNGVYDLGDLLAFLDRNHLKVGAALLSSARRKENLP